MILNDFILRMIHQLARALARMVGLVDENKLDDALKEGEKIYDRLGVPKELVEIADSSTVGDLLEHPEKIRVLAQVLVQEARVFALKKDPIHAAVRERQALELLIEAERRSPSFPGTVASAEISDLLETLVNKVPQHSLGRPYRAQLK